MNRIYINKINRDFNLELCKVNKSVLCDIPLTALESISRSINDIDFMDLSIDKYIYNGEMKKVLNPLWNEMKDERLICLNGQEYFVIKENNFKSSENKKSIKAHSLEYKLGKIDIAFEDMSVSLMTGDDEYILNLNQHMENETGWKFGHIDESVRYDIVESEKSDKVRYFAGVDTRWYDFLTEDISQAFNCTIHFDTLNKTVNLYDVNTVAENIQIYLSNDNYIKETQRVSSTADIVTRMTLVGSEEMDIISATVTGYPYVENYSYFMDCREMSDELISDLTKYNEMVSIRQPIWEELILTKQTKNEENTRKKRELYAVFEEIRALNSIKEIYASKGDTVNEAKTMAEITKKQEVQVVLEVEIKNLEEEILALEDSIVNINTLCKRETATDENGNLIFTEDTLNELKEFVYCETYSNDSFLDVKDLIKAGQRELDLACYPTVNYTLDIKNFMSRIMEKSFRLQWQGDIGLGDIVVLYDNDINEEVYLFLTDYVQKPNEDEDNSLDITLSNKKFKEKNIRTIADKLKEGSLAMKNIKKKSYVFNNVKYNRINITKSEVGGNI